MCSLRPCDGACSRTGTTWSVKSPERRHGTSAEAAQVCTTGWPQLALLERGVGWPPEAELAQRLGPVQELEPGRDRRGRSQPSTAGRSGEERAPRPSVDDLEHVFSGDPTADAGSRSPRSGRSRHLRTTTFGPPARGPPEDPAPPLEVLAEDWGRPAVPVGVPLRGPCRNLGSSCAGAGAGAGAGGLQGAAGAGNCSWRGAGRRGDSRGGRQALPEPRGGGAGVPEQPPLLGQRERRRRGRGARIVTDDRQAHADFDRPRPRGRGFR